MTATREQLQAWGRRGAVAQRAAMTPDELQAQSSRAGSASARRFASDPDVLMRRNAAILRGYAAKARRPAVITPREATDPLFVERAWAAPVPAWCEARGLDAAFRATFARTGCEIAAARACRRVVNAGRVG